MKQQPQQKQKDKQGPADRGPEYTWPAARPLPTEYAMRRSNPCPACRRVLLDTLSRAAVVTHTRNGCAYLRCRSCGHRWKAAIRPG